MNREQADSALFSHFAHELLAGGATLRFEAKGRSMWPTIHDGDVLHVQSANLKKLRVGDVVLFKCAEGMKAHRIIRRRGNVFMTRGDAGADADGEIRREQIVGKVVGRECGATGQLIPLSGTWDRARFFFREMQRLIARS